jgi:oligopeptide transport system substrate-binding protein
MAIDKTATARYLGTGQLPAKSRVPPLNGYSSPAELIVRINGQDCDVLAFNPRAARELWLQAAGPGPHVPLPLHYPARLDSRLLAEIQQAEWKRNLGIDMDLRAGEPAAFNQFIYQQGDFRGVAEDSYMANFPDPYDLLGLYAAGYPSWSDLEYDKSLAAATSIRAPVRRMSELSKCESVLMKAMPFIPLYFDTYVYLERPEVRGLRLNPLGVPAFKYAWFDSSRGVQ